MKLVQGLPPKLGADEVALDLEIFRANPRQLHRPYGDFASLGISDGKTVWMIERVQDVEKALQRVNRCRWIMHNATFDLAHLRRWADIPRRKPDLMWDTFLVERILFGGWYDDFALNDLARRYLNIYLSKDTRKEYSDAKEVSPEMREYAGKDPLVTYQVYKKQEPLLKADPQSEHIWRDIDCPTLFATLAFKGITLNTRKWKALTEKYRNKAEEIQAKFPRYNLNAPAQVKELLKNSKITVPDTLEKTLLPFKGHPVVAKILDYREASKRASSYGDNILAMVESDGKIHPGFKVTGAETGRTVCDGPNLQNQPNEFDYRDCYEAPRTSYIVDYDYSKQEPNIEAQISRDPEALRLLRLGVDLHLNTAQVIFDDPTIHKKGADGQNTTEYKTGKTLNLGLSYGLSANGLSMRTGLPIARCKELVARYFQTYRGKKEYIDLYRQIGRQDSFVRSPAGRKVWLNWYSYQANNNAINAPIQAGGADMTKLAIAYLHTRYEDIDFPMVGPIHDELLAEVVRPQARKLQRNIEWAMLKAYTEICPDVHAKTVYEGGLFHTWGEKP